MTNVNSIVRAFKDGFTLLTEKDPRGGIRAVLRRLARKGTLDEQHRLYWKRHRTYMFVPSKQLLLWPLDAMSEIPFRSSK
jgi:hypothetical protein